jgi:hypothetical protein
MQVSGCVSQLSKGCANMFRGPRECPWLATRGVYSPQQESNCYPIKAASAGSPDLSGAHTDVWTKRPNGHFATAKNLVIGALLMSSATHWTRSVCVGAQTHRKQPL